MTDQPISQTINRDVPSMPMHMTSTGAMLGASAGLSFGLYKGIKVAGCTEAVKYSPEILQSTATATTTTTSMSVECTQCAICTGIPVGGFLVVGCLGAVVLGSIGYAFADPEQRAAFRQDLIDRRFTSILCPGLRDPDRASEDRQTTFRNPAFHSSDDESETIFGHTTDVVVDQPAPPPYDDLFPPPPSYEEAARALEHEGDQPRQPNGAADSSTPGT